MSFFRSIALLAGVCLCIAFAYFAGHGLSTHHVEPILYGTGLLLLGAGILALLARRREPADSAQRH
ncbi:MAG TPA: hypothetical protein VMN60_09355 [Longimicrobiales bacterium]|nr:hypothetical protein [Longimicrobiales bacterium]